MVPYYDPDENVNLNQFLPLSSRFVQLDHLYIRLPNGNVTAIENDKKYILNAIDADFRQNLYGADGETIINVVKDINDPDNPGSTISAQVFSVYNISSRLSTGVATLVTPAASGLTQIDVNYDPVTLTVWNNQLYVDNIIGRLSSSNGIDLTNVQGTRTKIGINHNNTLSSNDDGIGAYNLFSRFDYNNGITIKENTPDEAITQLGINHDITLSSTKDYIKVHDIHSRLSGQSGIVIHTPGDEDEGVTLISINHNQTLSSDATSIGAYDLYSRLSSYDGITLTKNANGKGVTKISVTHDQTLSSDATSIGAFDLYPRLTYGDGIHLIRGNESNPITTISANVNDAYVTLANGNYSYVNKYADFSFNTNTGELNLFNLYNRLLTGYGMILTNSNLITDTNPPYFKTIITAPSAGVGLTLSAYHKNGNANDIVTGYTYDVDFQTDDGIAELFKAMSGINITVTSAKVSNINKIVLSTNYDNDTIYSSGTVTKQVLSIKSLENRLSASSGIILSTHVFGSSPNQYYKVSILAPSAGYGIIMNQYKNSAGTKLTGYSYQAPSAGYGVVLSSHNNSSNIPTGYTYEAPSAGVSIKLNEHKDGNNKLTSYTYDVDFNEKQEDIDNLCTALSSLSISQSTASIAIGNGKYDRRVVLTPNMDKDTLTLSTTNASTKKFTIKSLADRLDKNNGITLTQVNVGTDQDGNNIQKTKISITHNTDTLSSNSTQIGVKNIFPRVKEGQWMDIVTGLTTVKTVGGTATVDKDVTVFSSVLTGDNRTIKIHTGTVTNGTTFEKNKLCGVIEINPGKKGQLLSTVMLSDGTLSAVWQDNPGYITDDEFLYDAKYVIGCTRNDNTYEYINGNYYLNGFETAANKLTTDVPATTGMASRYLKLVFIKQYLDSNNSDNDTSTPGPYDHPTSSLALPIYMDVTELFRGFTAGENVRITTDNYIHAIDTTYGAVANKGDSLIFTTSAIYANNKYPTYDAENNYPLNELYPYKTIQVNTAWLSGTGGSTKGPSGGYLSIRAALTSLLGTTSANTSWKGFDTTITTNSSMILTTDGNDHFHYGVNNTWLSGSATCGVAYDGYLDIRAALTSLLSATSGDNSWKGFNTKSISTSSLILTKSGDNYHYHVNDAWLISGMQYGGYQDIRTALTALLSATSGNTTFSGFQTSNIANSSLVLTQYGDSYHYGVNDIWISGGMNYNGYKDIRAVLTALLGTASGNSSFSGFDSDSMILITDGNGHYSYNVDEEWLTNFLKHYDVDKDSIQLSGSGTSTDPWVINIKSLQSRLSANSGIVLSTHVVDKGLPTEYYKVSIAAPISSQSIKIDPAYAADGTTITSYSYRLDAEWLSTANTSGHNAVTALVSTWNPYRFEENSLCTVLNPTTGVRTINVKPSWISGYQYTGYQATRAALTSLLSSNYSSQLSGFDGDSMQLVQIWDRRQSTPVFKGYEYRVNDTWITGGTSHQGYNDIRKALTSLLSATSGYNNLSGFQTSVAAESSLVLKHNGDNYHLGVNDIWLTGGMSYIGYQDIRNIVIDLLSATSGDTTYAGFDVKPVNKSQSSLILTTDGNNHYHYGVNDAWLISGMQYGGYQDIRTALTALLSATSGNTSLSGFNTSVIANSSMILTKSGDSFNYGVNNTWLSGDATNGGVAYNGYLDIRAALTSILNTPSSNTLWKGFDSASMKLTVNGDNYSYGVDEDWLTNFLNHYDVDEDTIQLSGSGTSGSPYVINIRSLQNRLKETNAISITSEAQKDGNKTLYYKQVISAKPNWISSYAQDGYKATRAALTALLGTTSSVAQKGFDTTLAVNSSIILTNDNNDNYHLQVNDAWLISGMTYGGYQDIRTALTSLLSATSGNTSLSGFNTSVIANSSMLLTKSGDSFNYGVNNTWLSGDATNGGIAYNGYKDIRAALTSLLGTTSANTKWKGFDTTIAINSSIILTSKGDNYHLQVNDTWLTAGTSYNGYNDIRRALTALLSAGSGITNWKGFDSDSMILKQDGDNYSYGVDDIWLTAGMGQQGYKDLRMALTSLLSATSGDATLSGFNTSTIANSSMILTQTGDSFNYGVNNTWISGDTTNGGVAYNGYKDVRAALTSLLGTTSANNKWKGFDTTLHSNSSIILTQAGDNYHLQVNDTWLSGSATCGVMYNGYKDIRAALTALLSAGSGVNAWKGFDSDSMILIKNGDNYSYSVDDKWLTSYTSGGYKDIRNTLTSLLYYTSGDAHKGFDSDSMKLTINGDNYSYGVDEDWLTNFLTHYKADDISIQLSGQGTSGTPYAINIKSLQTRLKETNAISITSEATMSGDEVLYYRQVLSAKPNWISSYAQDGYKATRAALTSLLGTTSANTNWKGFDTTLAVNSSIILTSKGDNYHLQVNDTWLISGMQYGGYQDVRKALTALLSATSGDTTFSGFNTKAIANSSMILTQNGDSFNYGVNDTWLSGSATCGVAFNGYLDIRAALTSLLSAGSGITAWKGFDSDSMLLTKNGDNYSYGVDNQWLTGGVSYQGYKDIRYDVIKLLSALSGDSTYKGFNTNTISNSSLILKQNGDTYHYGVNDTWISGDATNGGVAYNGYLDVRAALTALLSTPSSNTKWKGFDSDSMVLSTDGNGNYSYNVDKNWLTSQIHSDTDHFVADDISIQLSGAGTKSNPYTINVKSLETRLSASSGIILASHVVNSGAANEYYKVSVTAPSAGYAIIMNQYKNAAGTTITGYSYQAPSGSKSIAVSTFYKNGNANSTITGYSYNVKPYWLSTYSEDGYKAIRAALTALLNYASGTSQKGFDSASMKLTVNGDNYNYGVDDAWLTAGMSQQGYKDIRIALTSLLSAASGSALSGFDSDSMILIKNGDSYSYGVDDKWLTAGMSQQGYKDLRMALTSLLSASPSNSSFSGFDSDSMILIKNGDSYSYGVDTTWLTNFLKHYKADDDSIQLSGSGTSSSPYVINIKSLSSRMDADYGIVLSSVEQNTNPKYWKTYIKAPYAGSGLSLSTYRANGAANGTITGYTYDIDFDNQIGINVLRNALSSVSISITTGKVSNDYRVVLSPNMDNDTMYLSGTTTSQKFSIKSLSGRLSAGLGIVYNFATTAPWKTTITAPSGSASVDLSTYYNGTTPSGYAYHVNTTWLNNYLSGQNTKGLSGGFNTIVEGTLSSLISGTGKSLVITTNLSGNGTTTNNVVTGYSLDVSTAWLCNNYITHLYSTSGSANGKVKFTVYDNTVARDSITISGSNRTSVSSNAQGVIVVDTQFNNGRFIQLSGANNTINNTLNGDNYGIYISGNTNNSSGIIKLKGGTAGNILSTNAAGSAVWTAPNSAVIRVNKGGTTTTGWETTDNTNTHIAIVDEGANTSRFKVTGTNILVSFNNTNSTMTVSGHVYDLAVDKSKGNGSVYLRLKEESTNKNSYLLSGVKNEVISDATGNITISGWEAHAVVTSGNALTGKFTTTNSGTFINLTEGPSPKVQTVRDFIQLSGANDVKISADASNKITIKDSYYNVRVGNNNGAKAATTNGNTYLTMMKDGAKTTDQYKISGYLNSDVSTDANGNITIKSLETHAVVTSGNALTGKTTTPNSATFINLTEGLTPTSQLVSSSIQLSGANDVKITADASNKITIKDSYYNFRVGNSNGAKAVTTNGNTYLTLMKDGAKLTTDQFKISGDPNIDVSTDANGNITIKGLESHIVVTSGNALTSKFATGNGTTYINLTEGLNSASQTVSGYIQLSGNTNVQVSANASNQITISLKDWTAGSQSVGLHDANAIKTNGVWYYTSNGPATSIGATTNDGALYTQAYSTNWVGQIAQDYRDGDLFVRGLSNGTWTSWKAIAAKNDLLKNHISVTSTSALTANAAGKNPWINLTEGTTDANQQVVSTPIQLSGDGTIIEVSADANGHIRISGSPHYTVSSFVTSGNNIKYSTATTNSNTYINTLENGAIKGSIQLSGAGTDHVYATATNKIYISGEPHLTANMRVSDTSGATTSKNNVNNPYILLTETSGTAVVRADRIRLSGNSNTNIKNTYDSTNGINTITFTDNEAHVVVTSGSALTGKFTTPNSATFINLTEGPTSANQTVRNFIQLSGANDVKISADASNKITIKDSYYNVRIGNSNGAKAATTNGNTYLTLMKDGAKLTTDQFKISGTKNDVSTDGNGNITVTGWEAHAVVTSGNTLTSKFATGNTNTYINLTEGLNSTSQTVRDAIQLTGTRNVSVAATNGNKITITGPDLSKHALTSDITHNHIYVTSTATLTANAEGKDPWINLTEGTTDANQKVVSTAIRLSGVGTVAVSSNASGLIRISGAPHYTVSSFVTSTAALKYSTATTNANTYINTTENGAIKGSIQLSGAGTTHISADASNKITISGAYTNLRVNQGTTTENKSENSTTAQSTFIRLYEDNAYRDDKILLSGTGSTKIANTYDSTKKVNVITFYSDNDTHKTAYLRIGAKDNSANTSTTFDQVSYLKVADNGTVSNIQLSGINQSFNTDTNGILTISGTPDTHYNSNLYVNKGATDANGKKNLATTNADTYIRLVENNTCRDTAILLSGAGSVTVNAPAADGKIRISGTNTTYSLSTNATTTNGSAKVYLSGSDGSTKDVIFTGTGKTTVTSEAGKIIINSTDANTHLTANMRVSDVSGATASKDNVNNPYIVLTETADGTNHTPRADRIRLSGGTNVTINSRLANGINTITFNGPNLLKNHLWATSTSTSVTNTATSDPWINLSEGTTDSNQAVVDTALQLSAAGGIAISADGKHTIRISGMTDTNTLYGLSANAATTNGKVSATLYERNGTNKYDVAISGTGATTVTSEANKIKINSTDTNTRYNLSSVASITTNGNAAIQLLSSSDGTNFANQKSYKLSGDGTYVKVTTDTNGNFIINGTHSHTVTHNDRLIVGKTDSTTNLSTDWNSNGTTHLVNIDANKTSKIKLSGINIQFKSLPGADANTSGLLAISSTPDTLYGLSTNATTTNGNVSALLYENGSIKDHINIVGTGKTTVTSEAGKIIINSTDDNTHLTSYLRVTSAANLTASKDTTNGNTYIILNEGGTNRDDKILISGNNNVSVKSTYDSTNKLNKIIIDGTHSHSNYITDHYTVSSYVASGSTLKYSTKTDNDHTYINTLENGTIKGSIKLKGQNNVSISADASNNIIIDGTHSHSNYLTSHYTVSSFVTSGSTLKQSYKTDNSNTFINTLENGTIKGSIQLSGGTNVSISANASNKIDINLKDWTAGTSANTTSHDANAIKTNGVWYYNSNGPATSIGATTTDGALYTQAYNEKWVGQIAQDYRDGDLFVRGLSNGAWTSWKAIAAKNDLLTNRIWATSSTTEVKPAPFEDPYITLSEGTTANNQVVKNYIRLSGVNVKVSANTDGVIRISGMTNTDTKYKITTPGKDLTNGKVSAVLSGSDTTSTYIPISGDGTYVKVTTDSNGNIKVDGTHSHTITHPNYTFSGSVSKTTNGQVSAILYKDGTAVAPGMIISGQNNIKVTSNDKGTIIIDGTHSHTVTHPEYTFSGSVSKTTNGQVSAILYKNGTAVTPAPVISGDGTYVKVTSDTKGNITINGTHSHTVTHNDKIFVGGDSATDNATVDWNNNGSHYILHSSDSTSKIKLSGINVKFKTINDGTLAISATTGGSGADGIFDCPDYSKLTLQQDPGFTTLGQGHTFLVPVPKDTSFAVQQVDVDNSNHVFAVWAPLNGSSTSQQIVNITGEVSYSKAEDGWLRVTVIDNGSHPEACVRVNIGGASVPLYKFGGSGVPHYDLLKHNTYQSYTNTKGFGNSWILPVRAGKHYMFYSTAGSNIVEGTFVSNSRSAYGNITNGEDFVPSQDGWIRISTFDDGTHVGCCLRINCSDSEVGAYSESNQLDAWLWGTPLYRYSSFGNSKIVVGLSDSTSHTNSTNWYDNGTVYLNSIDENVTSKIKLSGINVKFKSVAGDVGTLAISASTGGGNDGNTRYKLSSVASITTNGSAAVQLLSSSDGTNFANQNKFILSGDGTNVKVTTDSSGNFIISGAPSGTVKHEDKLVVGGSNNTANTATDWNNTGVTHLVNVDANKTTKIALSGINVKFKSVAGSDANSGMLVISAGTGGSTGDGWYYYTASGDASLVFPASQSKSTTTNVANKVYVNPAWLSGFSSGTTVASYTPSGGYITLVSGLLSTQLKNDSMKVSPLTGKIGTTTVTSGYSYGVDPSWLSTIGMTRTNNVNTDYTSGGAKAIINMLTGINKLYPQYPNLEIPTQTEPLFLTLGASYNLMWWPQMKYEPGDTSLSSNYVGSTFPYKDTQIIVNPAWISAGYTSGGYKAVRAALTGLLGTPSTNTSWKGLSAHSMVFSKDGDNYSYGVNPTWLTTTVSSFLMNVTKAQNGNSIGNTLKIVNNNLKWDFDLNDGGTGTLPYWLDNPIDGDNANIYSLDTSWNRIFVTTTTSPTSLASPTRKIALPGGDNNYHRMAVITYNKQVKVGHDSGAHTRFPIYYVSPVASQDGPYSVDGENTDYICPPFTQTRFFYNYVANHKFWAAIPSNFRLSAGNNIGLNYDRSKNIVTITSNGGGGGSVTIRSGDYINVVKNDDNDYTINATGGGGSFQAPKYQNLTINRGCLQLNHPYRADQDGWVRISVRNAPNCPSFCVCGAEIELGCGNYTTLFPIQAGCSFGIHGEGDIYWCFDGNCTQ